MEQFKYLFKVILIGDSNVGKSSIMLRFTTNRFRSGEYEPTIGVEFGSKMVQLKDDKVKLQLWDTAGQESFRSITRSYYRSSIGAVLVFDLSNRSSFLNAKHWMEETKKYGHEKMQVLLVGNKSDLDCEVTEEETDQFCADHKCDYFKTSAVDGSNVQEVFAAMGETIYSQIVIGDINPATVLTLIAN